MGTGHATPSEATEAEEVAEAGHAHETGPGPTTKEEAEADRAQPSGAGDVGPTYREMTDLGANTKGEGGLR